MIIRHIIKSSKKKWLSLVLLGIIISLSSMVYTAVDLGINTVETSTNNYLRAYVQEDFTIKTTPVISEFDRATTDECGVYSFTLNGLYETDKPCFYEVLENRKWALEEIGEIALEPRVYKDSEITFDHQSHDLRVFRSAESINQTNLTSGTLPQNDTEIALLENYMNANDLVINDTIMVDGTPLTITGTILLPDYTLPAIVHPLLFTTNRQSLGIMHSDGFDALTPYPSVEFSGLFLQSPFDVEEALSEQDASFYMMSTLTENNMRSGLIYTEIEGTRGTALFLSVLMAFLGIVIVGLILKKMTEQSRRPFGILRALGIKEHELFFPFLIIISVYSLVFLFIGFLFGVLLAPLIQDFFLDFYLLPKGDVQVNATTLIVAVFTPLSVIVFMTLAILVTLLKKAPLDLIYLKVQTIKKHPFKPMKAIINKLSFMSRMQLAFLSRTIMKVIIYIIGIFSALIMLFTAIGMGDVFEGTIDGYYDSIDVNYIGYIELGSDFEESETLEKVIEMEMNIDNHNAFVVGLNNDSLLHPLIDSNGNRINDAIHEGIVISESFSLLSGIEINDKISLKLGSESYETHVSGIADIYPGEHVFIDRETLAETFFENEAYYNAVYSSDSLESDDLYAVINVANIQRSMEMINDLVMNILYVIMVSGLLMGMIIIYLLSVLTVEDHYYNIALLKVLGYKNNEINKMLLGGYDKIAVLLFFLAIPSTILIYHILTTFIAQEYGMVLPFSFSWYYIFIIGLLYGMIYVTASWVAKRKIKETSLQAALQIYQH